MRCTAVLRRGAVAALVMLLPAFGLAEQPAQPARLQKSGIDADGKPLADSAAPPAARELREVKANPPVVTVQPEGPRYALPESLKHWAPKRAVPMYAEKDASPWEAAPTERRLKNAAVSCSYKDEGGVRGKMLLLIDNYKLSRYTARVEMPNGGVCEFDSRKMRQKPAEQGGITLESKDDECVVRMWEQKHRITVAAYSCHKQCSKGSFSYLWPIIADTRVGTCY